MPHSDDELREMFHRIQTEKTVQPQSSDDFRFVTNPREAVSIGTAGRDPHGAVGEFHTCGGLPNIRVFETDVHGTPFPPLKRLCSLAHEYGHYLSWYRRLRPQGYEAAIQVEPANWPRMKPRLRDAILLEEHQAWRLGRPVLEEVGFKDWCDYDLETYRSLGVYVVKLHGHDGTPALRRRRARRSWRPVWKRNR